MVVIKELLVIKLGDNFIIFMLLLLFSGVVYVIVLNIVDSKLEYSIR